MTSLKSAKIITKYLSNITSFTTNSYLLLTYLLSSIPLPVNNFVRFTSISFFYAFDFTGLGLGLVGFDLGLTLPGLSLDFGLTIYGIINIPATIYFVAVVFVSGYVC